MSLKSADQIISVDKEGKIAFTVPQETRTMDIEELRMAAEQARVAFDVATDNLERAITARDRAQAIFDAANILKEQAAEAEPV